MRDVARDAGVAEPTVYTAERRWTPGQLQDWWRDTLTELLLAALDA